MAKRKSTKGQTKHTHKTKDRVTRTRLKTGVNSGAPEGNKRNGKYLRQVEYIRGHV